MLRSLIICLLCLTLPGSLAIAEEKPINIVSCRSGTTTMLTADKELVVFAYDMKGIDQDLKEDNIFKNYTHMCVGVSRILRGELLTKGYCKYMAPEGDYFIVSYDGVSGKAPLPWEYIYGTGKWKGVTGEGTVKTIASGKPIVDGSFQMCIEVSGTYNLPK